MVARGLWRIAVLTGLSLVLVLPAHAAQFEEILPGFLPTAVGVGWGDYDGDGYPDLFVPGNNQGDDPALEHGPYLFHNSHDLTFTDVSQTFGFPSSIVLEQNGVSWGDYNNDGLLDLLVGSGAGYPMLYRRDSTQFVEVGAAAGFHVTFVAGRGTAWCDYNGDNLLTLSAQTSSE